MTTINDQVDLFQCHCLCLLPIDYLPGDFARPLGQDTFAVLSGSATVDLSREPFPGEEIWS